MEELFHDYLHGRSDQLYDLHSYSPELETRNLNNHGCGIADFEPIKPEKIKYVRQEQLDKFPKLDVTEYVLEEVYLVKFSPLRTTVKMDTDGKVSLSSSTLPNNPTIHRKLALRPKNGEITLKDNVVIENQSIVCVKHNHCFLIGTGIYHAIPAKIPNKGPLGMTNKVRGPSGASTNQFPAVTAVFRQQLVSKMQLLNNNE